ncbi:hypothetical protein ACIBG4_18325 [Nonomuraea sp. NPDC050383]|uniref:hypothetical protein n=1 Tax=Nonomuraea sp. NPDC050383 TaxID=3364362 RepID=UPI0037A6FEA3
MMSHRHNWPARPDEGHRTRMAIGDLARAAAPPGWSRLTVRRTQVGAHALTTLICDGREVAAEGVDEQFQRLRELSYRADAGTWFTCELEFTAGSRGYTGHVDSSAPPFADVPARAALAELTLFPHEEPPAGCSPRSPPPCPSRCPPRTATAATAGTTTATTSRRPRRLRRSPASWPTARPRP